MLPATKDKLVDRMHGQFESLRHVVVQAGVLVVCECACEYLASTLELGREWRTTRYNHRIHHCMQLLSGFLKSAAS